MEIKQSTERFEIWRTFVTRKEVLPRSIYFAFPTDPKDDELACYAVVDDNQYSFLEWVYVADGLRRTGVASEVLSFIEQHGRELIVSGSTPVGDSFCKNFTWRYPRLEQVNRACSLMLGETARFQVWRTNVERTTERTLEILHVWNSEEDIARPVCLITLDPLDPGQVRSVILDGLDWDEEGPELTEWLNDNTGISNFAEAAASGSV
jgi:GNAT superfamily N-acetyltransferase